MSNKTYYLAFVRNEKKKKEKRKEKKNIQISKGANTMKLRFVKIP